jgi:hypothetical protein
LKDEIQEVDKSLYADIEDRSKVAIENVNINIKNKMLQDQITYLDNEIKKIKE